MNAGSESKTEIPKVDATTTSSIQPNLVSPKKVGITWQERMKPAIDFINDGAKVKQSLVYAMYLLVAFFVVKALLRMFLGVEL